jgi:hypothetical protein
MKRSRKLTIATVAAMLTVLGGTAIYAQDKYTLVTTSGIAFSDFKGYEDWAVVSSAGTNEILKVIVANPSMIAAFKSGIPGNGRPFPDGSKIAKLQWEPEEGHGGHVRRGCTERVHTGVRHRKGRKEISGQRRVGICTVQLRSLDRHIHSRSQPLKLRIRVPRGREDEGLHLPPVREALNRVYSGMGYTCRSPSERICEGSVSPRRREQLAER